MEIDPDGKKNRKKERCIYYSKYMPMIILEAKWLEVSS